jgi:L-ascorbate 6-phosphate lactonase
MFSLADQIASTGVGDGEVCLWWLGQAGFALKNHAGSVVYVDPYLSDAVERLHGFKRLSLSPIAPDEVLADLVVLTHEHADHLDPDALPVIASRNPACRFAAPAGCEQGLREAGIAADRCAELGPTGCREEQGIRIHTAPADHGDFAPSAVAVVLAIDGVGFMFTGDTSLRPGLFQPLLALKPDVLLPCINGVFGNMSHIDAAMLVQMAAPRIAVPCHYWTFAEQGAGDPGGFLHACRHLAPATLAMVLRPGEPLVVERAPQGEDAPA